MKITRKIQDYVFFGPFRGVFFMLVDYLPERLEEWLLYQLYPSDAVIIFKEDTPGEDEQ